MNAQASEVSAGTAAKPAKAKTEVVKVKLVDGREVEFAGKRKMLKEALIDRSDGSVAIRLDFRNGDTRTYPIPSALLLEFAGHGAGQKYGDELAGHEGSIDDMVADLDLLNDRIQKGEWSAQREGGGGAGGTSVLIQALMEFKGRTKEQVREFLADKTQGDKVAMRNHPKIKPIIDRLEAEKSAKSGTDAEALLEGF